MEMSRGLPVGSSPRMRGAPTISDVQTFDSGSSPRMRGAQIANSFFQFIGGIIPAYAGSTL